MAAQRRVFLFGIGDPAWQRKFGARFSEAMGGPKRRKPRQKARRAARRPRR